MPWPGKPVFFSCRKLFPLSDNVMGFLAQDNYGPNKIGWVTLPQKVNGEKNQISHNSVLQAFMLQKFFRALYFRFIKSELACLVFNGAGNIKEKFWLKFNHCSNHLMKVIMEEVHGPRFWIWHFKFILFSFLLYLCIWQMYFFTHFYWQTLLDLVKRNLS